VRELVLLQAQELALVQLQVQELALQVQELQVQELVLQVQVQLERQAQRLSQGWQTACNHGQTLHGQIDLRPSLVRAGP
jgi:hypothetical protein